MLGFVVVVVVVFVLFTLLLSAVPPDWPSG